MNAAITTTYNGVEVTAANYADRFRLSVAAQLIDAAARESSEAGILAIEAGVLEEAAHSVELGRRHVAQFIALDAREQNVDEIRRRYQRFGVEAVRAGVDRLLGDDLHPRRKFELVYALRCYSGLEDDIAIRLSAGLWGMVAPGGKLLIANRTSTGWPPDQAHSVPRNRISIRNLLDGLRAPEIAACQSFEDSTNSLAYLIATKS